MLFKATDRQAKSIAVTALEACGIKVAQKDIAIDRAGPKAGIHIDSMLGKPVKLTMKKQAEKIWYVSDSAPKSAGWVKKYESFKKLVATEKDVEVFGPLDAVATKKESAKEKPVLKKDELVVKAEEKRKPRKAATKK